MRRHADAAFALIGRYITTSIAIAGVLVLSDAGTPWWCAFPLTTIWMILRGDLRASQPHDRDR